MGYSFLSAKSGMRMFSVGVIVLWVLYTVLIILAPANEAGSRYGLNAAQVNLLRVTILIPYLFIWLSALFATLRFRRYTALVKGSPESGGFKKMTVGLALLLAAIIIPPFISLVSAYNADTQRTVVIINNYVTIGLYLIAFWHIWQASKQLRTALGLQEKKEDHTRSVVVTGIVLLSAALAWFIFHNDFRTVSDDPLVRPTYYLNDWLIALTILVPYVLIWLAGSLAIVNVRLFVKQVPGVVYRQAFYSVARGLVVIILLSIILQFLLQASTALGHAALGTILIILYLLILAIAVGYLFLARGARRLSAIEEV